MKKLFTWKLWKLMKICAAQGLLAVLICGVSFAYDNYAQVLDKKISVTVSNVSFDRALDAIAKAAQAKFAYSSDLVNVKGRITINVANTTVRAVLDELLVPRQIRYTVHKDGVTIFLKPIATRGDAGENETGAGAPPLDPSVESLYVTVSGTVLDVNKQPIAGVNVVVKGSTSGTTTDAAGKFSIDAEQNDVLVFSFIGYASQEVHVGNQTEIEVILSEDIQNLGEVVVNAGYWQVTDRERTGNISRVTAEDIKDQPVSNPLMAIQGRMPGVVITQTSGVPGSGMKLQIRGQNSLRNGSVNNGNYPLYVIDGVPIASSPIESYGALLTIGGIDPLNTIDPSNIESIEILKDADATAIYGSRGANGVVLITTKKGTAGATTVDVQAYAGVGQVSKMMDIMNTEQYLSMRNEAFMNDGKVPGPSDFDLNGTWDKDSYTDWQKKLFGGTARISNIHTSFSGGSGTTSFRVGGGYYKETTVFPGDFGFGKATAYAHLNHVTPDQRLRIALALNYGRSNNDLFNKNVASYALTLPPNAPLYDDEGNLEWAGYTSSARMNPLSFFETSHTSQSGNMISNLILTYEVLKGLTAVASLGYNDTNSDQILNTPQSSMNPSSAGLSKTTLMEYSGKNWIVEPQLRYATEVGGGRLDLLIGSTWQAHDTKSLVIQGQGFVSDGLLGNIQAASSILVLDNSESRYRYNGFFARAGYVWMDRFLLNLTARRDGSSRFGSDNQFGNFGAIGAGCIFSNAKMLKASSVVSFGKLRISYGITGNDQIGDYGYLSTYSSSSTTYQGDGILNTTSLANPEFGWEVNKKFEMATDLGLYQDRIRVSGSWYQNRSSNQLVGYPLPAITGFNTVQSNLNATVQNTGIELELSTINIQSNNLSWKTAINLTLPRNKLLAYPNLAGSAYANIYVVGEPLNIAKKYSYKGVNPETGIYEITDMNGDGSYTDTDKQSILDLSREYYGGLQNTFVYKSFQLNFVLQFVKQKANDYLSLFGSQPGSMYNQLTALFSEHRWQAEGDDAELQKFTQMYSPGFYPGYYLTVSSDRNYADASFLRLKTVSLSWNFPESRMPVLRGGRLYIQAQNLFTITNYFGFNPEFPYLELPPLKVFSAGIQLKF